MEITHINFTRAMPLTDLGQELIWPDFAPSLAWGEWLICERVYPSQATLVISPDDSSLLQIVRSLLPRLGLSGLSRLAERLAQGPLQDWDPEEIHRQLLLIYGFRANPDVMGLLKVLRGLPLSVQTWLDQKGFGARDLYPLLSLKITDEACAWFEQLSQSSLSKSLSAQAIEWAAELILMKTKSWADLKRSDRESHEAWHLRLRRWRHPDSEARQSIKQQKISALPWPRHTQGIWKREGDEDGLHIRLEAHSPEELKSRWQNLSQLIEQLQSEASLWKY